MGLRCDISGHSYAMYISKVCIQLKKKLQQLTLKDNYEMYVNEELVQVTHSTQEISTSHPQISARQWP